MNTGLLEILPALVIINIVWLIVLSVFLAAIFRRNRSVAAGLKNGTLLPALERALEKENDNSQVIAKIKKDIEKISDDSKNFIQKVGLVRYNPFNETGGDQSFSLCLLNEHESGFIVTCLHTRDRSRVYSKPITKGKSRYELSKEESEAVRLASKEK